MKFCVENLSSPYRERPPFHVLLAAFFISLDGDTRSVKIGTKIALAWD